MRAKERKPFFQDKKVGEHRFKFALVLFMFVEEFWVEDAGTSADLGGSGKQCRATFEAAFDLLHLHRKYRKT